MPIAQEVRNSDEIVDIIEAVPSWLLRWGVSVVFFIIVLVFVLAAFIQYPDIVKTSLKVNSMNAPKTVVAKVEGKLTSLLVADGEQIQKEQSLAFIESTARHEDVIALSSGLLQYRNEVLKGNLNRVLVLPFELNLGELQASFQVFMQEYVRFVATQQGGHYLKQKEYLQKDLNELNALENQILEQRAIQVQELENAEERFRAYEKLYEKKVISKNEYKLEESKFLASKHPLQQSRAAMLNNNSSYVAKQKEILDLNYSIDEQQSNFLQSLSNLINQVHAWKLRYILTAPVSGQLSYAGIVQENQNIVPGDEMFVINPGDTDFFGEIQIPQYNMGKIQIGQKVLVKLHSYPFEQYGMIRGKVSYISKVAYRDSVFIAKISFETFENKDSGHRIMLKNGMLADTEIITEDSTLLQRFLMNVRKMMNSQ